MNETSRFERHREIAAQGVHYDGAQHCATQGAKVCGQMVSPFIEQGRLTRSPVASGLIDRDRSPMDAALVQLDCGLDAAMASIERLERHLAPVLRPQEAPGMASGANETKPCNSAVVTTLQAYDNRLRAVVNALDALTARVEC